jgi:hypothetical protein
VVAKRAMVPASSFRFPFFAGSSVFPIVGVFDLPICSKDLGALISIDKDSHIVGLHVCNILMVVDVESSSTSGTLCSHHHVFSFIFNPAHVFLFQVLV